MQLSRAPCLNRRSLYRTLFPNLYNIRSTFCYTIVSLFINRLINLNVLRIYYEDTCINFSWDISGNDFIKFRLNDILLKIFIQVLYYGYLTSFIMGHTWTTIIESDYNFIEIRKSSIKKL